MHRLLRQRVVGVRLTAVVPYVGRRVIKEVRQVTDKRDVVTIIPIQMGLA